jgi:hypothetical protein
LVFEQKPPQDPFSIIARFWIGEGQESQTESRRAAQVTMMDRHRGDGQACLVAGKNEPQNTLLALLQGDAGLYELDRDPSHRKVDRDTVGRLGQARAGDFHRQTQRRQKTVAVVLASIVHVGAYSANSSVWFQEKARPHVAQQAPAVGQAVRQANPSRS